MNHPRTFPDFTPDSSHLCHFQVLGAVLGLLAAQLSAAWAQDWIPAQVPSLSCISLVGEKLGRHRHRSQSQHPWLVTFREILVPPLLGSGSGGHGLRGQAGERGDFLKCSLLRSHLMCFHRHVSLASCWATPPGACSSPAAWSSSLPRSSRISPFRSLAQKGRRLVHLDKSSHKTRGNPLRLKLLHPKQRQPNQLPPFATVLTP